MNLTTIKKLPTFEELIQRLPMSDKGFEQIAKDVEEVKNILLDLGLDIQVRAQDLSVDDWINLGNKLK